MQKSFRTILDACTEARPPWALRPVFLLVVLALSHGCGADLQRKGAEPYVPPAICAEAIPAPQPATIWFDDSHAGDHVFTDSAVALDLAGNLVSVDLAGNVVRRAHDGTLSVLAERVVRTGRGLAYLSTGELVIADSGRGMLVKVYPDGQSRILVPHLDYPDGLVIDRDDTIYVSESSRGAISRVNPRTGALTTVAQALPMSPGGLSFSPDYKTLYVVGSDASIYSMSRDESGTWGPLTRFATVPGVTLCDGKDIGAFCAENGLAGICVDEGYGDLACLLDRSCEGKAAGDACTDGRDQLPGVCVTAAGDVLVCQPTWPCAGKTLGQACTGGGGFSGVCADPGTGGALFCDTARPVAALTGVTADACGNLYLPDQNTSALYRLSPDGKPVLFHHWEYQYFGHGGDWGSAVGGWRTDALYMAQPEDGNTVTEIVVGIPGQGH